MNRGRTTRGVVAAALAGTTAAMVAGYVFDGAGRPAVGFWAVVWGSATFLTVGALCLLLGADRSAVRRLAKGVLALTLGAISYGVLWWAISTGTPPASLEGAWLWPLGIGSLAGALWAARGAISRRS